ncbi:hypothetical protein SUGI_1170590 [Cryptomeria japonica]|nr:hypothetical protein SUGI_1170590 [Cryptomeria japonica]
MLQNDQYRYYHLSSYQITTGAPTNFNGWPTNPKQRENQIKYGKVLRVQTSNHTFELSDHGRRLVIRKNIFLSPLILSLNHPIAAQSLKESAISEVTNSNLCGCNSMKLERKAVVCMSRAVVCMSRSEVRNTGGIMSEEEARIKAELAEEIEKALQKEIEQQISALTRRLEDLRHQNKSEISVKKPSPAKGVLPKIKTGGGERKKKFKWESSLRSESSCESGSFRRRPWNDLISNPSPPRNPTVGKGKENCRCAERVKNSL